MNVYKWYKASRILYLHHIPIFPMIIKGAIRVMWGGTIPYQADIGEGTLIGYQGIGVVIHKKTVIGKNCHISQNVTFGGGHLRKGSRSSGTIVHSEQEQSSWVEYTLEIMYRLELMQLSLLTFQMIA